MVEIQPTAIPGLLIVELPVHGDQRGWFKENWQRQKMVAAGLPDLSFVQNNVSFNAEVGTTRGIHAEPWDKYVSVATGKAFGAWVDLRAGSSFGAVVTAELIPGRAVFVPRGVGNSFQTLENNTAYSYLVNDHWTAEAQDEYTFLNLADSQSGIQWPILLAEATLSAKDHEHPSLDEVVPMQPASVVILGAGGQLGKALVSACEAREIPFKAFTRAQWDVSRPESWPLATLRGIRAVINAAAYTNVDGAETPEGRTEAWAANAGGVAALTSLCRESDTPLLHVSTDYVFDGTLPVEAEYSVDHPVSPVSVYGQSKAAGEAAVSTWAKHWIVRTSWVIGEGKNFVRTMQRLAEQGVDPSVVDDQHGRLTFAEDLASGLLHMVESNAPWGLYHLSNSGPVMSWFNVAQAVFDATGHDPERVKPISTEEYSQQSPTVAPRPRNSALSLRDITATGYTAVDALDRLREYCSATQ